MAQDGHGRPPGNGLASNALGSFDLSKKSAAQLAAELAAQMTSWRHARKKSDAGAARAEPAGHPVARTPTSERLLPPTDWGIAIATHIDRAQRAAARAVTLTVDRDGARVMHPASFGEPFRSLLEEGPNLGAVGMGPQDKAPDPLPPAPAPASAPQLNGMVAARAPRRGAMSILKDATRGAGTHAGRITVRAQQVSIAGWHALGPTLRTGFDQVRRPAQAMGPTAQRAARAAWPASKSAAAALLAWARASAPALGMAARHAVRDKLAIAGAAAIIIAIAAWILAPHGGATPPEAARAQPEAARTQKVELQPAIEPHAIVAAFEATNRPKAVAIDRPKALPAAELRPHDPAALRLSQQPALAFIPTLTPRLKPTVRTAQH